MSLIFTISGTDMCTGHCACTGPEQSIIRAAHLLTLNSSRLRIAIQLENMVTGGQGLRILTSEKSRSNLGA